MAEVVKKVSRNCHNKHVFAAVESHDKNGCFNACPQPKNTSSACWVTCFYSTMLGPNSGQGFGEISGPPPRGSKYLDGHMPIEALQNAWLSAFRETDPNQGGCPNLLAPPDDNSL